MALLSPWFLLGLLAVAGPLVAHLRRLNVQKRVAFSAVDLLEARPPRSARRSWEDVALLAARIAVLGLLSLAFARPYLPVATGGAGAAGELRRLVVLLDTSASMRRGKTFEEARGLAIERVARAEAPTALELRTFDRSVRTVLPFAQWQRTPEAERGTLFKGAITAIEPGWSVARLDEALRALAEQHNAEAAGGYTEVMVVSDFQEGSSLTGLQGYEWPQRFGVTLCKVGPQQQPAGVTLRWLPPDLDTAPSDAPCRVQVVASADFQAETVKLLVEGSRPSAVSFPVVAGKSKVASFPQEAVHARVRAEGFDDIAAATWVARVPQRRALVAVAVANADASGKRLQFWDHRSRKFVGSISPNASGKPPAEDKTASAYFVRSALGALGEARVESADAATLPPGRDAEVALWVVCSKTDPALEERIRNSVEGGATALVLLAGEADAPSLSALSGIPIGAKEKALESFVVLGAIAREHPLFAPFQAPQFSDFTAIRFWKYRALELPGESGAQVLARFEGGDPALVEVRRGEGRVLAWASDWRPADGQWVLSSRCVPFLAACVELAGGGRRQLLTGTPGESFPLPPGSTGVRNDGGGLVPVSGGAVVLDQPGVYPIEPGGGIVVVNIAPEEASAASLPEGKLEALGVPVNKQAVSEKPGASGLVSAEALALGELESRQGAWRFVLAAVLGLLVVETLWAARITQKRKGIA